MADGHSIVDVLFGSEKIAHLINSPSDDNLLTLSEFKTMFMDQLMATDRTAGHVEGPRIHLDHFIRVLGDVRVMSLTDAVTEHIKALPKRSKIMFPIFDEFDYSGSNERWKRKSKRTVEQRRGDRADRLFEKLVEGTDFGRLDGYHALRHSFISILVAQGKTWDQIVAFVGHLDQRTTQRYIHCMPKD